MANRPPTHTELLRRGRDTEADRAYNRERRDAIVERYRGSGRWKRLRAWMRVRFPVCQQCEAAGRARVSTEVHHVVPARDRPDLFFDVNNLRALCADCHAVHSGEERRAGP